MGISDALRSLRQPNYRRFFLGQLVSMTGTFMQVAAIPWVVWELTHSPSWLGAANFINQIPFLLLGLMGGAIADRFPRRGLIGVTQTVLFLQAIILAALAFAGKLTLGPLVVLIFLSGLISAVDFPARHTFVMDLVGPDDLSNAIALNATQVHSLRFAGPVLAGLILFHFGAGTCFLVNALSYIAIIVALLKIRPQQLFEQRHNLQEFVVAIRDGFRIVKNDSRIRKPLLLVAFTSLAGGCYIAFLPYVASVVFSRGADLMGYLMAASAAGALAGAVYLARARNPRLERWLVVGGLLISAGLIVFSRTALLSIAYMSLFMIGTGFVTLVSGTNTIIQLRAPVEARGRIVSYLTTAFFGLIPVGSFISGLAAEYVGVATVIGINGGLCLLATLWYMRT